MLPTFSIQVYRQALHLYTYSECPFGLIELTVLRFATLPTLFPTAKDSVLRVTHAVTTVTGAVRRDI